MIMPGLPVLILVALSCLSSSTSRPVTSAAPFAFVMIDAKTENALGEFPYDRAVLAKAVERAAEGKAKAVVLNFYLDKPKSAEGDRALMMAMWKIPVALEACIVTEKEQPGESNPLPHRFELVRFGKNEPKAINGDRGWIPIPDLAERAAAIGFANSTGDIEKIPIVHGYRAAYVKSFWTVCLELAFDDGAVITPGREMLINDKPIELDEQSQGAIEFPKNDQVDTISFIDFLNGKVPPESIQNRVVIIGADTAKMPTVDTPIGKLGIHRAKNLQLLALHAYFAAR